MTFKRNLIAGITIGTAVLAPSFVHANEVQQQYENLYVSGVSANDTLNIRNIETNEIIDTVKNGEIVIKLEDVKWKKGWALVKTPKGVKGICNTRYLSAQKDGNQKNIKVTSNTIELRTGAGRAYRIYKTVPKNSEVELISIANDWAKIKFEGRILYCPKFYIAEQGNTKVEESASIVKEANNIDKNTNNTENNTVQNNVTTPNEQSYEEKVFTSSASVTTLKSSSTSVKNAKIALDRLNGMVIRPGQKFSYLDSIGPITKSNGYVESTVIKNGKTDTGIGGGVCLASTTVYNAMIEAGIEPLQRRNHSLASAYKERGLDAMVATGSSDLSFINNTGKTLTINTSVKNGLATVSFSSKGDHKNGYTFKPRVEVYNNNLSAKTYLQKLKNGVVVSEKFISQSNYLK